MEPGERGGYEGTGDGPQWLIKKVDYEHVQEGYEFLLEAWAAHDEHVIAVREELNMHLAFFSLTADVTDGMRSPWKLHLY